MLMKYNCICRQDCKTIRAQLNEELVAIGKKLGLKIDVGDAKFGDNQVTFKVQCVVEGVDKEKEDFEAACILFGLKKEHYKHQFDQGTDRFELIGFKANRPKYPLVARCIGTGKTYKFSRHILTLIKK